MRLALVDSYLQGAFQFTLKQDRAQELFSLLSRKCAEIAAEGVSQELTDSQHYHVVDIRFVYWLWRPFYHFNCRVYQVRVRRHNPVQNTSYASRN